MRLLKSAFAVIAAVAAAAGAAFAEVTTKAPYAIIMDYETGAVLYEKDADTPTHPSSMSKLMTAAIVFERLKTGQLKLTDEFPVSVKAWKMEGSKMWTRVDTKISLEALLNGIIVQSGNDACVVVAEGVAGSEEAFADLMTKKAREWGLANSTFANSTGWPDENHKMSTRDLALLARKIIKDFPEYYAYYARTEFTWEKIRQPNRNPLLYSFKGADGLKTGHTETAGYGLVGSAELDGQRRIIVVNGLASEKERAAETERLMRIAFNDFTKRTLYPAGAIAGDALVFAGKSASVPLVAGEAISMIVSRADAASMSAKVIYEGPVEAPIEKGQQIGVLRITQGSSDAREFPLYAGESVKAVGPLGRIGLAAKMLFAKPPAPADAAAPE
jgi:D-alanyl-D-alanine carboxypeptidase (penicillin-binding protein 5/6)